MLKDRETSPRATGCGGWSRFGSPYLTWSAAGGGEARLEILALEMSLHTEGEAADRSESPVPHPEQAFEQTQIDLRFDALETSLDAKFGALGAKTR